MEASTPPKLSPGGESGTRVRLASSPLARAPGRAFRAATSRPQITIVATLVVAIAALGALAYLAAQRFTRSAAETRAGVEATSFANHSSLLATGDAFNGYLQILRYAEDPAVRAPATEPASRRAALQQLLYLNTNKFAALAVSDPTGVVLASTDPTIADLRASQAFDATRARQGPSNSDIIVPEAGQPGYVEYATPISDTDGTTWAILYARADPARVWIGTLGASVDGGRNVIINSQGQFAAGVPDEQIGVTWSGAAFENGAVAAEIAGVDSICGLGPIGKDTQIDHGWFIASCLPASLVQVEADRAMGKLGLVTAAGALLAVVLAAAAVRLVLRREPPEHSPEAQHVEAKEDGQPEPQTPLTESPAESTPPPAPAPVIVADVDALALVAAYERRAELAANALRDEVQARLMIVATHFDEARELEAENEERAAELHRAALAELEDLRTSRLRTMGQELHPGLVRIGLAGALRALAQEFEDKIALSVDVDPDADSVDGEGGRTELSAPLRLAVFRLAHTAIGACVDGGATACDIVVRRQDAGLTLVVSTDDECAMEDTAFRADAITFEAHGGHVRVETGDEGARIEGSVPLAPLQQSVDSGGRPSAVALLEPMEQEHGGDGSFERSAPITAIGRGDETPSATSHDATVTPLPDALRALAAGLDGTLHIELDIDPAMERPSHRLPPDLAGELLSLAGDVVRSLTDAGAEGCRASLTGSEDDVFLSIRATAEELPDVKQLEPAGAAMEARGGRFTVSAKGNAIAVTAEVPVRPPDVQAA